LNRTFPSERVCLLIALATGALLRLPILLNAPAIELDGIGYATMADDFTRGLFGRALSSVFPPVYPLSVALLHLAIPDVELAGRLVSFAFGILLIYVSFLFAKRLLRDDARALWAAILLALQPYLIRYSGQVLSESLATFLFATTVFTFYIGWQDGRRGYIAASGLCLTLTYLTRPEYVVFYAPFLLYLWARRRILESLLFLLPFLLLGSLYMGYLWSQTGVWMVSRKAMLSPFVPLKAFFGNVPIVSFEFFVAIFPLFFFFAVFGLKKIEKPYRNLFLVLVICHILSLSFVSHATRRYSVEFIPISIVFVVEGIYAVRAYLGRTFPGRRSLYHAMVVLVVCASLFQSFTPAVRSERGLHKRAGLFLLRYDPGSVVASRLPLVAFYEKGTPVELVPHAPKDRTISHFFLIMAEKKVKYVALDEEAQRLLPDLAAYLSKSAPLKEFREKGAFVSIYRVGGG